MLLEITCDRIAPMSYVFICPFMLGSCHLCQVGNFVAVRNYRYFHMFLVMIEFTAVCVAGCNVATIVLSVYHILYCIIQKCQAVEKVCSPQEAVVKKDVKSKVVAKKWL